MTTKLFASRIIAAFIISASLANITRAEDQSQKDAEGLSNTGKTVQGVVALGEAVASYRIARNLPGVAQRAAMVVPAGIDSAYSKILFFPPGERSAETLKNGLNPKFKTTNEKYLIEKKLLGKDASSALKNKYPRLSLYHSLAVPLITAVFVGDAAMRAKKAFLDKEAPSLVPYSQTGEVLKATKDAAVYVYQNASRPQRELAAAKSDTEQSEATGSSAK